MQAFPWREGSPDPAGRQPLAPGATRLLPPRGAQPRPRARPGAAGFPFSFFHMCVCVRACEIWRLTGHGRLPAAAHSHFFFFLISFSSFIFTSGLS